MNDPELSMFSRLRLKLTLFNVVIIGSIIFIVFIFFFLKSPDTVSKRISDAMRTAVKDSGLQEQRSFFLKDCNIIKVDRTGKIVEKHLYIKMDDNRLADLARGILESNEESSIIKMEGGDTYIYLKTIGKSGGLTAAFINTAMKARIFTIYVCEMIAVVISGLLLIFAGSLAITSMALKPVRKAWRKQADFTSDASHELRTPLAVIRTNLELVLENENETVTSQKKWLMNIRAENIRMSKLVEDLLALSRSDNGQISLNTTKFILDEAFAEVIDAYSLLAGEKGVEIVLKFAEHIEISGNRDRLRQMLLILVDNAIKYTNKGGRIEVYLVKKGKSVEIVVSDTGIGIAGENLERIFDRFFREDNRRNNESEGSGLGLSIAKRIVEEHKGTIKAESMLGQGTRFLVSIPFL